MKSLHQLAYEATIKQFGILATNIQVGKKYKLIEMDGVNTIHLGKCLEHIFSIGGHHNDFKHECILTFEFNNNHPLLRNNLYYENVFSKINVIECEDDDVESIAK